MTELIVPSEDEFGWTVDMWDGSMAEDMLLRSIKFDLATRSLEVALRYNGFEFEGAPTGDWIVEIVDVETFTLTRLANWVPPVAGAIDMTAVSPPNYTLFSREVILRAEAPAAHVRRGGETEAEVALASREVSSISADDEGEWQIDRWVDAETSVWDCLLESVRFDIAGHTLTVDVVEEGSSTGALEGEKLSLVLDAVASLSIATRQVRSDEPGLRRLEFGYADETTYHLYHPELMLSASVEQHR